MSSDIEAGCVEFRPGIAMRVWRKLGFSYGSYIEPPNEDEAHYTTHHTITHWDWLDRLRILISGKTETILRVHTADAVVLKGTQAKASALAPNASR